MQSAMLTTLLEEYLGEISSRMYYYLLRKVRSGGEVTGGTGGVAEETARMSVNRLYKIVNDLDFLFEMRDLFHRMFSRYSDISLIQ
jgi:hypothetical protein